jgi:hypothetical protein
MERMILQVGFVVHGIALGADVNEARETLVGELERLQLERWA